MECCGTLVVPNSYRDPALAELYEARGVEYYDYNRFLIIPSICKHLTHKGCDIYNDRPLACRMYDGRMLPFMKDKCKWYGEDF